MRYFLSILPLLLFECAFAQVITVMDKESGVPLEFATIACISPTLSVTTNSLGQADISELNGCEHIDIRIIGYSTIELSFADIERMGFTINLSPSVFSIDQVVVSATKRGEASRIVPMKVRTISSALAQLHNPQTAADLLSITGDVFIQKSQQGGGSPIIRGFSTNRLLIAVDGVRMNNAIFRSGNLHNVISLDPFAIERTEVLFGPGSVMYGSDAIGGVMSFFTLKPKHSTGGKLLVSGNAVGRYSSANSEKTGHFDLNLGWVKWAMVTSITHTNFGHLRMGSNGPNEYLRQEYVVREDNADVVIPNPNPKVQIPTAYWQTNIMQKVSYKPNGYTDIIYALHYSTTSNFDRYDRLTYYRNGLPRSAEWFYGPQVWIMNSLSIASSSKQWAYDKATITAAHQHFEESRNDRNLNASTLKNRTEKVNALSLGIDLSKAVKLAGKLLYGAEVVYNEVISNGINRNVLTGAKEQGPSRYPQSTWLSFAGFATYQHKVNSMLTISTGARYNQFSIDATFNNTFYPFPFHTATINSGALTGSFGISINPSQYWRITSNLSTGFRAPNIDDMGKVFDSTPGSVVIPNPSLKSEYAYNAEVSVTRLFGNFLEMDFLSYYTLLDGAMVKRPATLNGESTLVYDGVISQIESIQNAAFARVWGLQTDFELKLPYGLLLASRVNYQKGVEELDNGTSSPLRHAAPWFGMARIAFNGSKLKIHLYTNFNGEVSNSNMAQEEKEKTYLYATDKQGNAYSPAWYTLNIKSQYQLNQLLQLQLDIENITDQRYRPYSSGLVAPGLNVIVGARLRF